jgi:hypothetical protein
MTGLNHQKYIQLGRAFDRAFEASEEYRALADIPAADVSDTDDPLGRAYARARCSVERRMRDALATGELEPLVRDPITGEPVALTDREKWTRPPTDMHHGLGTFVNHMTNPGPETNGRPVHLERAAFLKWLNPAQGTAVPGKGGDAGFETRQRERSAAREKQTIDALRAIKGRCIELHAADKLPRKYDAAATLLKTMLGDKIDWKVQTIRKVISGRHPLSNDLVASGRAEPFWKEFW